MSKYVKQYGWKYSMANLGAFVLSFFWPISFFFAFMFKDEKDEAKKILAKRLYNLSIFWIIMQLVAVIMKYISTLL